jgi:hypothetical protein
MTVVELEGADGLVGMTSAEIILHDMAERNVSLER